jgi:phosphoribosylformimino-5-aminoimidazole carboxamide ribotide isomerase
VSPQGASTFDLYPAIDLRAGHVVRLRQGDFAREQVYDDDPAGVATGFAAVGATWIHVVDLDGALAGRRSQAPAVERIVAAVAPSGDASADEPVRVQVAGGLRDGSAVGEALAAGAARAVVGSVAITNPRLVGRLVRDHGPDRIAVALDVRDGFAVGHGWVPGAPATPFLPALERLAALGVRTFIVTAIERDGLLGGPDLALLEQAIGRTDAAVIASGGVATLADLEAVRAIGCVGAIVGRAIYDGRIDLAEALRLTRTDRPRGPSTSR